VSFSWFHTTIREATMNHIRRITAALAALTGMALALAAAPAAFAARVPPPGGFGRTAPAPAGGLAGAGMPGWQITVIAVAAALAAATAAVVLDRARTGRRTASTTG
jgi:hypothetical protein